jgi:hypothetical protein
MDLNDAYGTMAGVGTTYETFEAAFCWGKYTTLYTPPMVINQNCVDAGNTPTWELRIGLVMGQITATGQWTAYGASNTDGSQVARGVLPVCLRMQDLLGNVRTMNYGVMVGGGVIGANLIGLDNQARAQMRSHFIFDDDYAGRITFPWLYTMAKTAAYQVLASDNGALFSNSGATGSVTFTLPPIANGYNYGFFVTANQNVIVSSTEGSNIVVEGNASASNVGIETGGDLYGGSLRFYTNSGATKWHVDKMCGNALTIT